MSDIHTFRRLATPIELTDSPFPNDSDYQLVLRPDNAPEAYRGGMGIVFHAREVRLRRDVAIKRMRPDCLAAADAQQRFLQEAQAQARLKHDNIVSLYTAKQDQFGPWLVLEWVDGQSLQELYDEERGLRPSAEDAVGWVLKIAEALIYVHERKLIHRDVKPGNILLRTSDRRPLLTDFGLVADRRLSRIGSGFTTSGVFMGMPDYAAPEQDQDASKVTPQADQWSLGATLAWLITGNTMRTLRERDLPVALRDLVFKATEKRPQDRFADLRQFRDALATAIAGSAVVVPPASSGPVLPQAGATVTAKSSGEISASTDPITASGIDCQCWKCGRINGVERKFCAGCGQATREACLNVNCQQPIGVWERFCPECGDDQQQQREQRQQQVQKSASLIRRHLHQQRCDLALAELQQLDSQYTTPRLRLLLTPVQGLEADVRQVQQTIQQILQQASNQGQSCDYAQALQTLQQVPDVFWPAAAQTWQQSLAELTALQTALEPLVSSGRLNELKQTLQRLEQLQPGRWSACEYIAQCVDVLSERARKLHSSDQLQTALEMLEAVSPTDRTDNSRQLLAALQEEVLELQRQGEELAAAGSYAEALELFRDLSEQRRPRNWPAWRSAAAKVAMLQTQLRQNPLQTGWEEMCGWLEELDRLQPGKWSATEHTERWKSAWDEDIGAIHKAGRVGEAWQRLQQIPEAGRTPLMRELLSRIQQWVTTVSLEAEQLSVQEDDAEAVRRMEQLPENLRPEVHQRYQQKARRVRELQNTLTADIERANLENALKTLGELQSLQPNRWQQEPRLAATVSSLVRQAEQLLQEGQTEKAGEVLAGIPVSLQTDAVRKVVQQQRKRAEDLLRLKSPFSSDVARAAQIAVAKWLGQPEEWSNSVGMKFPGDSRRDISDGLAGGAGIG